MGKTAEAAGQLGYRIGRAIGRLIDDVLLVGGCGCILYGLSMWNEVITWIAAGVMLVGLAFLVGKAKAKYVIE